MTGCVEGIRRTLVLGQLLRAGTAIDQAPSDVPLTMTSHESLDGSKHLNIRLLRLLYVSFFRKKLMSIPRRVQRSIWRLKMRCPTYSQVTTGQPLRCRWCDEDYSSITMHWLRHCPAMMYWQDRMEARLKEHECDLCDREAITAILNSQNAVDYEEINGLLRNFPLPEPNS